MRKNDRDDESKVALQSCIVYLLLSKYDNHQSDMMHRLKILKEVEDMPVFHGALCYFTTKEIIPFPFNGYDVFESHEALGKGQCGGDEVKSHFLAVLHKRVLEHNLRTVASYYRKIHCARLADMLGLKGAELERYLSEMSTELNETNNPEARICVKIDRPAGIVSFVKPRSVDAILSDWSGSVGEMLSLMESTCHLINRENMVHNVTHS
jgi:26S proteasome regulatory subunit N5